MRPRTRCRPKLRDESGAAAVEFALILGLLLTVLFAIVQFGLYYSEVVVLTGAAREGARVAAVREPDEVEERVLDAADPYTVNGSISVSTVCDEATQGDPVTVSWTQTIEVDLVLLWPITATPDIAAIFRCE
ncbi:MAG: TadE/TadG family type IV pilus assembly protein [Actinomycetota bacterium]